MRVDPIVWEVFRVSEDEDAEAAALESFGRQLHNWEMHGFGPWAAVDRDGEILGSIGASHPTFVPEVATEIEIGWLLRSDTWGRGLATEGARAAIDAASAHLAPERLISLIAPTNARSIAVAERLGMRPAETVVYPEIGAELQVYELRSSSGASPHSVSSR
jgi:RimJ/RimL family protein N-acetyltransferase